MARVNNTVTIYALVHVPTNTRIYTGRTNDPRRRFQQHAYESSKCRLVKSAFRKYGRAQFSIEPILRCHAKDADANESFWIIKNNTLYPNGCNLRHGSMAGEEVDAPATALAAACIGAIPFQDVADEDSARAECWDDVAEIANDIEEPIVDADDACKDLFDSEWLMKIMMEMRTTMATATEMLKNGTLTKDWVDREKARMDAEGDRHKARMDAERARHKLALGVKLARELNDPELEQALKKQFLEG